MRFLITFFQVTGLAHASKDGTVTHLSKDIYLQRAQILEDVERREPTSVTPSLSLPI